MNIYIVYEINSRLLSVDKDFALGNSIVGAVTLLTNPDPDRYLYSRKGIGFDAHGSFSLSDGGGFGKNVIMFCLDMSSLGILRNRRKVFWFLVKVQRKS